MAGVPEAAEAILRMIPGLEFVDLAQPRVGYMCNTLNPLPAFKREVHRSQLQAAADAGVTTLAGIYHACHRELCSHERDWPFEVVNFLELVGESMGLTRPDLFKRLKLMQDVDAVLADAAPMIATHGLDLDEARDSGAARHAGGTAAAADGGSRGAAARRSRSLIATPRPVLGTGMTAMFVRPCRAASASSQRKPENSRAAASVRSPRWLRLNATRAPGGGEPKASRASSGRRSRACRRRGRVGA